MSRLEQLKDAYIYFNDLYNRDRDGFPWRWVSLDNEGLWVISANDPIIKKDTDAEYDIAHYGDVMWIDRKYYECIPTNVKRMTLLGLVRYIEKCIREHEQVNSPSHYTWGGMETIDIISSKLSYTEYLGFLKGNILKYTTRAGRKGDAVTDYKKAVWYIDKLIEVIEERG